MMIDLSIRLCVEILELNEEKSLLRRLLKRFGFNFVQGDQLNIAVFFWYLVKSDLSNVRYCACVHLTSRFSKEPENHGHA